MSGFDVAHQMVLGGNDEVALMRLKIIAGRASSEL
jgi:hypothetical protein